MFLVQDASEKVVSLFEFGDAETSRNFVLPGQRDKDSSKNLVISLFAIFSRAIVDDRFHCDLEMLESHRAN